MSTNTDFFKYQINQSQASFSLEISARQANNNPEKASGQKSGQNFSETLNNDTQPTLSKSASAIESFSYTERQTHESEVAQKIQQNLLNEINQIQSDKLQDQQSRTIKINQIILTLISGLSNLCVIDTNELESAIFDGLPSTIKSIFEDKTDSPNFVSDLASEMVIKLDYIVLYLSRYGVDTSNISNQLRYLKNLLDSLKNHQTNMVPGFLSHSIYRQIAFNISNQSSRKTLLYNDRKLTEFLENIMLGCSGKIYNVNPSMEYSYLYLSISNIIKDTFQQYPNLSLDLIPNIYKDAATILFDRVLLPSIIAIATPAEQNNMKNRYFQLVQHFSTILFQKQQSIQKLKQLQKLQLQTA